jgi:phage terminase Nu1 subunit (DNA packaging protein)
LADALGVSTRSVTELADRELVKRVKHGQYDLFGSIHMYCAHLREMAAGRGDGQGVSLVEHRARLAKEQADAMSLKNEVQRRNLLPADEVEREWTDILRTVRSGVMAITSRLRQALPDLKPEQIATIDQEVRATLEGLGHAGDD